MALFKKDYNKFKKDATIFGNSKWEDSIERYDSLYSRDNDIRGEFYRDYTRILHSEPFRRLKRKTQVFFTPQNDHICTRIEHVNHVVSISYTIAKYLGLNTELTSAIALAHDIGHAPFGHEGERILNKISKEFLNEDFWHEKNGIWVSDFLATLRNPKDFHVNLSLTYGVRDGIISHCGEVNQNVVFPRKEKIELYKINKPNEFAPFTWEACIVKISDKIAYLGRDIEDAIELKLLNRNHFYKLKEIINRNAPHLKTINNTTLMNDLIIDLCKNSSPDSGICFSQNHLNLLIDVKDFNYNNIYKHELINYYSDYSGLIINTLFNYLSNLWSNGDLEENLQLNLNKFPLLLKTYKDWLIKYSDFDLYRKKRSKYHNKLVYNIISKEHFIKSVIDYIAGMTDNFAIRTYNELISF